MTIIVAILILVSCRGMMVKAFINKDIVNNAYYLRKGNQKLIYLPMVHVAKPKNYENVRDFINQKRAEGYTIYFEKVRFDLQEPNALETRLKMRKLSGLKFGDSILSDVQKNLLKSLNPDKYIYQKKIDYGVDFENDVHADYNLRDLINDFEKEYEPVVLDSCDYATGFDEKYSCERKEYYQEVVHTLRNRKLLNHILDTTITKKLVVYGDGHYWGGIYLDLVRVNNYEVVKKRNWVD